MNKVISLLESAETQSLLQENSVLIEQATNDLGSFYGILNNYIAEHFEEFLESNLTETNKSIYTFSAFATKQFLCELSSYYGKQIHNAQVLKESVKNEFC